MKFAVTNGDGTSDAATITFTPESRDDEFIVEGDGAVSIPLTRAEQHALTTLLRDLWNDGDGSIAGRVYLNEGSKPIQSDLLARLMAAVETPDDLTPDDVQALLEDAQAAYEGSKNMNGQTTQAGRRYYADLYDADNTYYVFDEMAGGSECAGPFATLAHAEAEAVKLNEGSKP